MKCVCMSWHQSVMLIAVLLGSVFLAMPALASGVRIAIVARPKGRDVADLLTVTLSRQSGMVVLERSEIDLILNEQAMSASAVSDPNSAKNRADAEGGVGYFASTGTTVRQWPGSAVQTPVCSPRPGARQHESPSAAGGC